jgi:hypothetical protein
MGHIVDASWQQDLTWGNFTTCLHFEDLSGGSLMQCTSAISLVELM